MLPTAVAKTLLRQATSETNPKSEYRNPKQTQRQINFKSGKSKTPNPKEACLEFYIFGHLKLFRISDFVLRISCSWRPAVFNCQFRVSRLTRNLKPETRD